MESFERRKLLAWSVALGGIVAASAALRRGVADEKVIAELHGNYRRCCKPGSDSYD